MNYICTHRDYKEWVSSGEYMIITSNKLTRENEYSFRVIHADNKLKHMQFAYAEGYMIYDIWLKGNDDWVGINHYRRYLINPLKETTLVKPMYINMHSQYAECHNLSDLLKVEEIIDTYFPEYSMDYRNINVLYPCNMFILNRRDFNKYCEFVFGVLDKFNEKYHLHSDKDVQEYVGNNIANGYYRYNKDVKYQSRLHGFLMERLGTIFFIKYIRENNPDTNKIVEKEILVVSAKIE